jgi:hypothetical protein
MVSALRSILGSNNMPENLLHEGWTRLGSYELRLLLDKCIGGPGQYDGQPRDPTRLHLPQARESCKIVLTFKDSEIVRIEPGQAFDVGEWRRISSEIEDLLSAGPIKVGRDYSFSRFRVLGSWRGKSSGVQILPPLDDAPRAPHEAADHPFILEFQVKYSDYWPLTNHRRMQEHRRLTLVLNVLLEGRTSFPPRRTEHFWANVPREDGDQIEWVQNFFFAGLDNVVEQLSNPTGELLEELEPPDYYMQIGLAGRGMRVPTDLDELICRYQQLSPPNRVKFDRATFWVDMASRQWSMSMSASFASLVSAVESLTERGAIHHVYCEKCRCVRQHEVPGPTENFRSFFETYAGGPIAASRRNKIYSLRSGILHGSQLMQFDQDIAFGWDPPNWNEGELHTDLWSLTRIALRNWLRNS